MSLSLKLAVISATVLSTAVMFNLLSPFINDLTISDLPTLWTSLTSWLKPPYLYVVINCIIITIVASSRLQSKIDGYDHHTLSTIPSEPVLLPFEPVKVMLPVELPPVLEPVMFTEPVVMAAEFGHVSEPDFNKTATEVYKDIKENKVDKSVISMSTWTPVKINQVDVSYPRQKPAASARFSHRKPTKATTEGGKTLGVTKPKRQETLETTWKTITEGRSVPLTRHLRKSDTWQTHGNPDDLPIDHHSDRMTKSDTFDVNRGGNRKPPPPPPSKLSRSGGSGRLKKEPSLGQEELNRRVEAFIRKFNEDMRLQRQESLNQYMEMINRGAH